MKPTAQNGDNACILCAGFFCLSIILGGCAVNGNSGAELTSTNDIITGSVTEPAKPEGIAETDAELIKSTVVNAKISAKTTPLSWSNPKTGSSGTIVSIDRFKGKHGQNCRGFKTSVDSFAGISFYNGETCQIKADQWVLSWLQTSD